MQHSPPIVGSSQQLGVVAAVFAYTTWGLFPLYFRQLAAITPLEILAWRIVLAFALLLLGMLVFMGPRGLVRHLSGVRQWGSILAATALITLNWFTFIYAIDRGDILQGSLGYFLVPLINTTLGILMFGERPSRLRQWAIVVAALGMLATFIVAGVVPVLALIIAGTFGLYSAVRKRSPMDSVTGLFLETALLMPISMAFLWFYASDVMSLPEHTRYWLMASGLLTVVPLLTMVAGARRIELGTLGIIQYITPIMQFGIAVAVYGEAIDTARAMAFATTVVAVALWFLGGLKSSVVKSA